ncbi:unnamed protein product [Durusdinium trenchii]
MSAMSGEARFTNENEVAFALLRKGCRHSACGERASALREVIPEQQQLIVSFLARVAQRRRRSCLRRVKELGEILAKASPSWQHLLENAEPLGGASGLLSEELQALSAKVEDAEGEAGGRGHAVLHALPTVVRIEDESRVFLRERRSQRYLSIAGPHSVVMTELPVSLFICHLDGQGASEFWSSCIEAEEARLKTRSLIDGPLSFALEHEGLPSHRHFLGSRRIFTELCCSSQRLGRRELFRLGKDTSLQHQCTGMCLYVDPLGPQKVVLSAEKSSSWEVLAAI